MRVSERKPYGRYAKLYNPDLFQEHEEVIVFTREDMNRRTTSILSEIDSINKIAFNLDESEEWKLISYWAKIMKLSTILT